MDSIRGSTARTSLRKTEGPELKSLRARLGYAETDDDDDEGPSRKPVDLGDLDLANLDFDSETEDDLDEADAAAECDNSHVFERVSRKAAVRMRKEEAAVTVAAAAAVAVVAPDVVHEGVDDDNEDDEIERSLRLRGKTPIILVS